MEKTVKKWGEYNTFTNIDEVNKASEFEIWTAIDNLESNIYWSLYNITSPYKIGPEVPVEKIIEAEYNLEFLINFTKKFGVEFDKEPSEIDHFEKSQSYNEWYQFWKELSLSPDKEDLASRSWKDSVNTK